MHGLGPRVGRVARVAYRMVMGFLKRCFGLMFLEFEVTLPSMLYVWDVAGAARGGEEESSTLLAQGRTHKRVGAHSTSAPRRRVGWTPTQTDRLVVVRAQPALHRTEPWPPRREVVPHGGWACPGRARETRNTITRSSTCSPAYRTSPVSILYILNYNQIKVHESYNL